MNRADLSQYRTDPVRYAEEYLGFTLTPDQKTILNSVRDHRYTAVKASHAIGKTFSAHVAANWWYDCWPSHICYVTAPSWDQALGLTFKQIKGTRLSKRLPNGDVLDSGWVRDPDREAATHHFIKALNAQSGEGFQGEHSAPILIIMEEAVGVPPYIWEAAKGLMTHPECRVLAIANPTDEASLFGAACASPLYHVLSISALDHPNIVDELKAAPPPFPAAVRLQWLWERLQEDCDRADIPEGDAFAYYPIPVLEAAIAGTPIPPETPKSVWYLPNASFQGRVLGQFPTQADEQVIPKGWLNALPTLPDECHVPEIGCDVARFGSDRSVIATRSGPRMWALKVLRQLDNAQVTAALKEAATEAARRYNTLRESQLAALGDAQPTPPLKGSHEITAKDVALKIDVTGGLGTGPFDTLKREGYRAAPVNSSSKPADKEQFKNRRSELWWTMRTRVREKRVDLSLLPQDVRLPLILELSTPKYEVDGTGRKVVEPKEKIKERLAMSPDLADAANLAFADPGRWWEDPELKAFLIERASPTTRPDGEKKAVNLATYMQGQQD